MESLNETADVLKEEMDPELLEMAGEEYQEVEKQFSAFSRSAFFVSALEFFLFENIFEIRSITIVTPADINAASQSVLTKYLTQIKTTKNINKNLKKT